MEVAEIPDKAIVRRYIMRSLSNVRYCYETQLLRDSRVAGEVDVAFLINPDGTVQTATASGMNDQVAACVAEVVRGIKFRRATHGAATEVHYPFTFRSSG